jgi:hypothetical protein
VPVHEGWVCLKLGRRAFEGDFALHQHDNAVGQRSNV